MPTDATPKVTQEVTPKVASKATSNVIPNLSNYLASSNPCLFIPTVEDMKVEKSIVDTMVELDFLDRELGIWKVTTGMIKYGRGNWVEELAKSTEKPIMDFVPALNYIARTPRSIGIFHHIRNVIKEPLAIQSIIDAAYTAKKNFSSIIFVGAFLDLPPELYSIITFCDYPLPNKEEIVTLFNTLMEDWKDKVDFFTKYSAKKRAVIIDKAATSALGLDLYSAENAIALAVSMTGGPNVKIIQSQKEQHVKKSEVLEYINTDVSLADVGGFSSLKKWLDRRKEAFSDKAHDFGLPWPKGILLVGMGGTGKSYAGKAIASFLELPLLRLDISNVFERYVGTSEANIKQALNIIEAVAPVVVICDEADKAFAGMESSGKSDSGITARVLSTLLTWRQETTKPVFMVFTANDPDMMPSMVYRKGRLDEVWAVDMPTEIERGEIFKIHIEKRKKDITKINLTTLAQKTEGYTGAEIEAAIEDALFYAFYENSALTTDHLLTAISETIPQSNHESEDMVRIREWMNQRARPVAEIEASKSEKKSNVINKLNIVRNEKKEK